MIQRNGKVVLAILAIASILTGCKQQDGPTYEELQQKVVELSNMNMGYEDEIANLERMIDGLSGTDTFPASIADVEDGSNKKTFQSIGGKILFSTELTYPGAIQAPNTSGIKISDKFTIKPSDNWMVQMNGNTTKYMHPNGIYGTIKVIKISDPLKTEEVKEQAVKPFVDGVPHTTEPEYDEIYFDDRSRGMQVTLSILNNNKPALIKSGVCGVGDEGIVYTFYYDGDKDNAKTELINSLLRSVKYSAQAMNVDS